MGQILKKIRESTEHKIRVLEDERSKLRSFCVCRCAVGGQCHDTQWFNYRTGTKEVNVNAKALKVYYLNNTTII